MELYSSDKKIEEFLKESKSDKKEYASINDAKSDLKEKGLKDFSLRESADKKVQVVQILKG